MKKKLYKYIFNPKKLDSKTVDQYKNFDALYDQYNHTVPKTKRPGKLRKILPWLGVAAAATVAFFLTVFTPNKNKQKKDILAKTEFVESPVENKVAQNFGTATVDADQGGTIKIKQTTFHIPPRAFVNRAGNLVLGPVDIKLKEYHDYVDFFVSGIPMEYDSLGTRYQLESAGMIEVYAEQEGERVELALGKTLEIQLEAEIKVNKNDEEAPDFNIYKLDQDQRNWVYEAEDKIEFIGDEDVIASLQNEESFTKEYDQQIERIENEFVAEIEKVKRANPIPAAPIKPSKADSNSFTFELDIDDLDTTPSNRGAEHGAVLNSEASLRTLKKKYEKAVWEVIPGQANWKPSIASTEWDDYTLKPISQFEYLVTFIKDDQTVDIKVKPVLIGDDYEAALSAFNQEFAAFEVEKSKAEANVEARKVELEEAKAIRAQAAKLALDEKIASLKAAGRDDLATDEIVKRRIVNMFSINSFGIWNCDRPFPAYVTKINAKFEDKEKNNYFGRIAYLVDDNRNTVFRFYADEGVELNYDMNANNIMWFVTKENKLAIYKPEDFKKIDKKIGKHTFVMDVQPDAIDDEEDIRRILAFD